MLHIILITLAFTHAARPQVLTAPHRPVVEMTIGIDV